jgi:putative DNA primase/helicase
MARMIPLTPPPTVVPHQGWELIATEAGRYSDGLRATIQVWQGTLQGCHQLALAHPQRWTAVAAAIATQVGCIPDEIVQALLMLTAAVEGILRQQADRPSGPRRHAKVPSPVAEEVAYTIAAVGLTKALADEVLKGQAFAQDAGGKLYHYHGGVYTADGASWVRRQVKAVLEQWGLAVEWSTHQADEVVEYLRVDAPTLWESPPLNLLNLKNGLFDLASRELLDHVPAHLSSLQLPIAYYARATCPAWEQFIADVFPPDAQDLAYEIIAWLMTADTSIQKAILLEGEGGNGKSTYLRAVSAFLGRHNIASLSLQKLEADRFAAARLVGKLANICPDLPSEHLAGTSMFKAITGGDIITAEYKYRDSFEYIPFARLVFSANHLPRSSDGSPAFFDRWIVIPFRRSFRDTAKEIPRAELDARLADPQELSGVLNKALAVLPRLRQRGFTISATVQQAAEEFRQTTDPLAVWLERQTIEHPDAMIAKDALVQAYNADCDQAGRPRMSKNAFGQALRRLRPHLEEAQRLWEGRQQVWVWRGLGLKGSETEQYRTIL